MAAVGLVSPPNYVKPRFCTDAKAEQAFQVCLKDDPR